MAKKTSIKCPNCGWEYLPGEIYMPRSFIGQPKNIIKDENGNVLGYDAEDMNTVETFECEHCGQLFKIDATVTFKTEPIRDLFDSTVFTSTLNK